MSREQLQLFDRAPERHDEEGAASLPSQARAVVSSLLGRGSAALPAPHGGDEGATVGADQVLALGGAEMESSSLGDFAHPVTAYLNSLAPSSRRPQLSALDWIGRRSTQVLTAETMPWHRLRRPQVIRIRGLLEEDYLSAFRPVEPSQRARAARRPGRALVRW